MPPYDVVVIGAGAAGLFCAGIAGQRGARVLLIDHAKKLAEKVRISGGGRCNFTNRELDPRAPQRHFAGANPHFCRSALSRYTPEDFIGLVRRHGIPFHEKHKGQLFGDRSSEDFIRMLLAECDAGAVTRWQPCAVHALRQAAGGWELDTDQGTVRAQRVVVATGGLSIPQIGASDFGLRLARQFELRIAPPRPALVPLTFDSAAWEPYAQLTGLSLPVRIETGERKARMAFDEDLLFTHRGLSGPAVLQISTYWSPGSSVRVDLCPGRDIEGALRAAKAAGSRRRIDNELAGVLPARLADAWTRQDPLWQRPVIEAPDKALSSLGQRLSNWQLLPTGTEGWRKAEVMAGGVDTRELSSQTLECQRLPGLHFIGEVVDVTGWLGGYNFQWAWASAYACAMAITAQPPAAA